MGEKTLNIRIKNKYDTEANWTKNDPVLLNGEVAYSSDKNNKYKVGNGTSKWSELTYAKANLEKSDVTTALGYTPPAANTWRGIQNNLTSDSTTDSLAAAQGKALKALIDGKSSSDHTHNLSTMINTLSTGSSVPSDNDYFISQYVGGGTTTLTYHRRPISTLWTYIKSKADSTYQAKGSYAASSHTHTFSQISDRTTYIYDASTSRTANTVLAAPNGSAGKATFRTLVAADIPTITKSKISDFPSSLKNPSSMIVKLNSGTTEGTNLFTYDGSSAKTVNITPAGIGAATSSHTHNYAGSSSAGGSANSAVKLATARTITIAGLDSASASFDGSGNITLNNYGYGMKKYVTQSTTDKPYVRIAYASATGNYNDQSMIFVINSGYNGGGFGIVKVAMRTDNISTANHCTCEVSWLVRQGFSANQLIAKINAPAGGTQYVDLYYKASGTYSAITIRTLTMGGRASVSRCWTFEEGDSRASMDIRTYTATTEGSDQGNVKYATSAGSASKLSGYSASSSATASTIALRNSSGHLHATYFNQSSSVETPTTSSYIMYANSDGYLRKSSLASIKTILGLGSAAYTASSAYATAGHTHNYAASSSAGGAATSAVALTTSAGSATQPVYFSSGKPVACTYTIGKSVPSNAIFTDTTYSAGRSITLSGTQFKLSDTCTTITDWNNATATGWYMASEATNAPTTSSWYFGMVIAHNSNYVIQELYSFTASTDAKSIPKYIRAKTNGSWGAWTNVSVQVKVPSDAKFTDTVYTHPTSSGNKHIPSGGSSGQILRWSADGTAVWGADNNTTYSVATTSANGLMSSTDKSKLDGISSGANKYTHPSYTAKASGLYKVTVDSTGHVSATTAVTKADITALGIPSAQRGIQNNLTSDSTTESLSAAQGKWLNTNKANSKTLTNEDLNSVTDNGFYSAGGGNSVTNKPSNIDHFGLIVTHNASGSYYTQIITNGNVIYMRSCINSTWDSWVQQNYLPISGGTMTGQIKSTSSNVALFENGNYGMLIKNKENKLYFSPTKYSSETEDLYSCVDLTTGIWSFRNTTCDINAASGKLFPAVLSDNISTLCSKETYMTVRWNDGEVATSNQVKFDTSDIRLKENIKDTDITNALSVINSMKIRQFDWKKTKEHQRIGFVADELEEIDEKLTIGGGWDDEDHKIMITKSVDSFYMLAYIVKAIQELSDENQRLKKQIENLST